MTLRNFDLNLLIALDTLLQTRSVTRASERLCIGASAVSSALARLRLHFQDDLLRQVGRRMELTPLAESLIAPVREIIEQTQSTIGRRPGFDAAVEPRHFVFHASDYVGTVFMPRLLARIEPQAPRVTLDLLTLGDTTAEKLERCEVDFAIYPDRYARDTLPGAPLFDERYCCVVWRDHPDVGDTLTLQQYLALGHVAARFGDSRVVSFESWFLREFGARRRVEVTTSTFASMPALLVGTRRIATMHLRLAQALAVHGPLRLLPPPVDIPPLRMVMQWHPLRDDDPAHQWMREQLVEAARGF